jgi:hypothetical protein
MVAQSVSIVPDYTLDDRVIEVCFSAEAADFLVVYFTMLSQ